MRRYWLERESFAQDVVTTTPEAMLGTSVRIDGDSLHHIRDVCRQRVGDHFEVLFDGAAFLVEVVSEKKREMNAIIREVRTIEPLPFPRIRVALAIPRFNVLESVLEKLVEMGVECIQPLFSDNSFIRTATETWGAKESRFEKIIQSATQQCGRGEKMRLESPRNLQEFVAELTREINQNSETAGLFAYEIGKVPIREIGRAIRAKGPRIVWIIVGGEGGFSREEAAALEMAGLQPATLGRQVLRVETACVALVSVLKYELDLMR